MRDVIYTKTRLRMPLTDQSSRRPQHRNKCTRRANCFIGHHLGVEWCRARGISTAAEWNQVVFSDQSRLNLRSDGNRIRLWRPRGESLNPAFDLQRHTSPTAGVMVVWGALAYNTRSPLVLISGTMTAQQYVRDILQPHMLPLM
ncbi:transposable element Tcb2 transposase [Trichonephila clavipes]|nr:transposable element Tcb2 transposase [Trichonephila clavipes]